MAFVPARSISLLTDFGDRDHYVGVMKGVILRLCPGPWIADITHNVEPFRIDQAAYLLSQAWPWFPAGTVHLAVVDPGVGSERRPIAALAGGHAFVLPDNGLLALLNLDAPVVREIRDPSLLLHPVSRTFHGRDIFAPTAAALARGFPFEQIGPEISDWVRRDSSANGVLHIDRFGNVVTGLRVEASAPAIRIGSMVISRSVETYAQAAPGELVLIAGSGGFWEVSEREASAAARIGCQVGDAIKILAPAGKS